MGYLKNTSVKFLVSEYTNPSGEIVFRVSGWLDGKRIRKNLPTGAEAHAERQALAFYLDYALVNYRDPVNDMSVAEAAKLYLAVREEDEKLGHVSHRQFTAFRCELRALVAAFAGKKVAELSAGALTDYFRRDNASKKTFNNRRGLVGAFLKYCLLGGWVATNVIEKIAHYRGIGHRRGSAPTLNAVQCAEIMAWAESEHSGMLVPFVALCLFAGIRPDLYVGEISKLEPSVQ